METLENIASFFVKHKILSGIFAFKAAELGLAYAFFPEETQNLVGHASDFFSNNIQIIGLLASTMQNEVVNVSKCCRAYSNHISQTAITAAKDSLSYSR